MSSFINLVRAQLQKGVLRAETRTQTVWESKHVSTEYVLPLPYSHTESTRMKFFPYYTKGDHNPYVRYFDNKTKKDYYQGISSDEYNNELLKDLREAMNKIGHDLGSRQIYYIQCHNCYGSNKAVEVIIHLRKPVTEQVAEPVTQPVA